MLIEKPQIQALTRTQPLLPMRPGQVERRSHHYVRHMFATSASWLNLVGRWLALLTQKRIRRGTFLSPRALEMAIQRFSGSSQSTT